MTTAVATYEPTVTELALAEMMTENTGIHMCDSGGTNGRMWQRNAGKTVATFHDAPAAYWHYGYPTLDTFHFLAERIEYVPTLSRALSIFAERDDMADEGWLGVMEAFAESLHDGESKYDVVRTFNSYNDETLLSQVFQWTEFSRNDVRYICLQIHGGADVRGGYTKPRVFKVTEGWYYQCADCDIYCTNKECENSQWSLMGPDTIEWSGSATDELDDIYGQDNPACPRCGSPLGIDAPYYDGSY
jgi:hypothetical protein